MTEAEMNRLLQAYGSGETPKRSFAQRAGDTARDVGKSIESGLTRGVVGIPGAPADIVRFGQMARDYMRSTNIGGPSQGTFEDVRKRRDARARGGEHRPAQALDARGGWQSGHH